MCKRSARDLPERPVLKQAFSGQPRPAPSFWRDRRVLITGVSGFTGRHLARALHADAAAVSGFDLDPGIANGTVETFTGSLLDQARIDEVVAAVRPEIVFHLAGIIRTDNQELYYSVNAGGTAGLLEAIARSGESPRVLLVSSSAVYGEAGGDRPVSEIQPLRPLTGYGHSKLAMEWISQAYAARYEIPTVLCRPFNLVGPGLKDTLALSAFAAQIVSVERGLKTSIEVGNLDARRDFLDVRDGVRAYRLLAEHGRPGEAYNVCSGTAVSIRDCLDILLSLSPAQPRIVHDPKRRQPADVRIQIGDPARIHDLTGWEPRIPLERSMNDLLEDLRSRTEPGE